MPSTSIETDLHALRYPIGPAPTVTSLSAADRAAAIDQIRRLPAELRAAARGLDARQLATPYRPGGWTVRQVVHHVPDSHVNAYVRLKLALTEDEPAIRPYDEERWAVLPDADHDDVAHSLVFLDALHARLVRSLETVGEAEARRTFIHPASGRWTVDGLIASYAWHGRHHVAHVVRLREREGWGS